MAIAVSRAGGIGVLDLEWGGAEPWRDLTENGCLATAAIQKLARLAKGRWGVKLDGEDEAGCEALLASFPCAFELADSH